MLRSAALIVLTSAEEESLAAPVLPPRAPRLVIPNPVDLGQFDTLPSPDLFRQRYLGGHTGRIVMNIGRLAQKKGLDRLIRAFAGVARSAPDCLLVLAGPDDDGLRPQLEALAAEADVTERVVFPGMLRGEAKLSALAAATVWVLPSHTENFGVAVVEAMAAGVPTVISPAVNISPEVAAAHAGVVVSNEPEKLGAALARLLGDEQERARLSRAGQAFARRFDRFEVGRQLARAYQPIARSAKPLDLRAAAWGVDA
jgi:glycosyltransferase involved in cell wall biosynthesis